MRKGFLWFVIVSVVVGASLYGYTGDEWRAQVDRWLHRTPAAVEPSGMATVTVQTAAIRAEVASTAAARAKGLSGRAALPPGTGMLFVFDAPGRHSFWMKEMRFSLDFVWINGRTVTGLNENVPAPGGGTPEVITPPSDVTHVLEVPAGTIAANRILVGSSVSITFD